MNRVLNVVAGVALLATTAPSQTASSALQTYTVTDLGSLGGCCPDAFAINDNGQVVGTSYTADGTSHAFLWQNGTIKDLGTLGGRFSFGFAISANGQIAGSSELCPNCFYNTDRAFVWAAGTLTNLDDPSPDVGFLSEAHGINSAGIAVGQGERGDGVPAPLVFNGGAVTKLPAPCCGATLPVGDARAINDAGQIVGYGDRATPCCGGPEPLLWDAGGFHVLGSLGGDGSGQALAISSLGHVVGWSSAPGNRPHAFLWQNGTMKDLGLLPGETDSVAYGVNSSGIVVGNTNSSACGCGPDTAFIYENGVMHPLNDLIPSGSGWDLRTARAINNHGQIVGFGFIGPAQHAFLLTPSSTDSTPPSTSAVVSPSANVAGWNSTDVTVALSAVDDVSGSGVKQITFSAVGAQNIPNTIIAGNTATLSISNEGKTTIIFFAADNAGNIEGTKQLVVMLDKTVPQMNCGDTDGLWHATDVNITCKAGDAVSGLTNAGDALFTLSTGVPAGTETASASTLSRIVCDIAGNCATAGPVGGIMIDKRPPAITIAAPVSNTAYVLNQPVAADYGCTDGGSGVATCTGSVVRGAQLDTASVGMKVFGVNASDAVGNGSAASAAYTVSFSIFLLSDPAKPENNAKVEVQLRDARDMNISSPSIGLTALSIDGTRSLTDAFTYTNAKGGTYKYNVPRDVSAGSHTLYFRADGDPVIHSVLFISR